MLRLGVTREWVGKGELPKKRTQSEVAEALRCAGRGHTWRDCSPSSSHKNLNAIEMSPRGDMVQRIMVEQFEAIQHTREKSREGRDHAELDCSSAYIRLEELGKSKDKAEALVVKGVEEVENAKANSKYQDTAEGQRPENFIRPVSTGFSSR
ncbi:hypothetical protein BHM03_00036677 [Ensete ventricosum]|nr:hypothetical protein BHM03_00036677 [Ensete ventricosum]